LLIFIVPSRIFLKLLILIETTAVTT